MTDWQLVDFQNKPKPLQQWVTQPAVDDWVMYRKLQNRRSMDLVKLFDVSFWIHVCVTPPRYFPTLSPLQSVHRWDWKMSWKCQALQVVARCACVWGHNETWVNSIVLYYYCEDRGIWPRCLTMLKRITLIMLQWCTIMRKILNMLK